MNKYHNRNRIISPVMTIHDILTLHIQIYSLSSFLSFSSSSLSLPLLFFSPLSSLSSSLSSFLPSSLPLSSIVKGAHYLTIQTSSVIVPGCPNDGEQTYMALFSHAYLLSAGASKRGAALK